MMKYLILFLIPAFASAMIGVEECKKIKAPLPLNTTNTKCEVNPCTITNGDMVGSITEFLIVNRTSSLRYKVDAYLGSFKIPLDFVPSDKRDACQDGALIKGICPAIPGDVMIHQIELPVDAPYDGMTISMEAYMIDEEANPIFCYRSTVTVEPAEGSTANPPPTFPAKH